jgi:serine/threonine protein kinase
MATTEAVIGQVLGHYRILEKVGAGGMGVVYRAHDERLDRDVALKVLPAGTLGNEHARRRFREEARTLARLNHSNIATIHDFDCQDGLDFLVMEYVAGMTLATKLSRGPLAEDELLGVAEQIMKPLEEAHERGIIHRDLKPSNIMLTPKGQLKLLDFGLAKLLFPGDRQSSETTTEMQPMGTLPYMTPEQLRGGQPDVRSDIYSAGVILYEMATGRRPFEGHFPAALGSDIITKAPVPPGRSNPHVSPKLEEIILKCLEKDPENRYQSAKEVTIDLRRLKNVSGAQAGAYPSKVRRRWLRALIVAGSAILSLISFLFVFDVGGLRQRLGRGGNASRIQSLAVLPLKNLSHDPEQEYFAEGMTDELITALGHFGALNVISRTSAMHYKGTDKTVPEIARELQVDAVLQGSVLRSGDRTRITAQLTDGMTDRNLWGQSYERNLRDVLALQDEVARAIAAEIQIRLTTGDPASAARTRVVNPEAHEAYLKGRYYWNKWTPEGWQKASEYFQEAILDDASYPAAYAGLADSYALLGYYGVLAPKDVFPRARVAALKALELDDTLSEAHTSLALITDNYDWNWARGEHEFRRALELNPSYAIAHLWYSYHLVWTGRLDAAIDEAKRAQALDPLSLVATTSLANILYDGKHYDEAIEQCRKVLELDPGFRWAHHSLGESYLEKGMFKEGIAELTLGLDPERRNPHFVAKLAYGLALSGDRNGALAIVAELERESKRRYIPPSQVAGLHVTLGNKNQALIWLEKAYNVRDGWIASVTVEPPFRPLHSDTRFREFIRRVGLQLSE